MTRRGVEMFTAGFLACGAGFVSGYVHGHVSEPRIAPVVCHFDGGGQIIAGNAARTSDGRDWVCTNDGTLVQITYPRQ